MSSPEQSSNNHTRSFLITNSSKSIGSCIVHGPSNASLEQWCCNSRQRYWRCCTDPRRLRLPQRASSDRYRSRASCCGLAQLLVPLIARSALAAAADNATDTDQVPVARRVTPEPTAMMRPTISCLGMHEWTVLPQIVLHPVDVGVADAATADGDLRPARPGLGALESEWLGRLNECLTALAQRFDRRFLSLWPRPARDRGSRSRGRGSRPNGDTCPDGRD